jgi:hypothetical protein
MPDGVAYQLQSQELADQDDATAARELEQQLHLEKEI